MANNVVEGNRSAQLSIAAHVTAELPTCNLEFAGQNV